MTPDTVVRATLEEVPGAIKDDASRIPPNMAAGPKHDEPIIQDFEQQSEPTIGDSVQIGSLLDSRLRMHSAVTISLEQEGPWHVAYCEDLNEFGYGTDPLSAVQDLRQTLAELYWELKSDRERLGQDLAQTWDRLSALIFEA